MEKKVAKYILSDPNSLYVTFRKPNQIELFSSLGWNGLGKYSKTKQKASQETTAGKNCHLQIPSVC